MTDKEKLDLLTVILMRAEVILDDPEALKKWWKDVEEALKKCRRLFK